MQLSATDEEWYLFYLQYEEKGSRTTDYGQGEKLLAGHTDILIPMEYLDSLDQNVYVFNPMKSNFGSRDPLEVAAWFSKAKRFKDPPSNSKDARIFVKLARILVELARILVELARILVKTWGSLPKHARILVKTCKDPCQHMRGSSSKHARILLKTQDARILVKTY